MNSKLGDKFKGNKSEFKGQKIRLRGRRNKFRDKTKAIKYRSHYILSNQTSQPGHHKFQ